MSKEINLFYPRGGIFQSLERIPKNPKIDGREIVKSILLDCLGYVLANGVKDSSTADRKIASLAASLKKNEIIDNENLNHPELLILINFMERVVGEMGFLTKNINHAMKLTIVTNIITANNSSSGK